MAQSVGNFLINSHIPNKYKIGNNVSANDIQKSLSDWAQNDPDSYSKQIPVIKNIADKIALYEGFSIGMDDIAPLRKERDALIKKYEPKFFQAKDTFTKKQILSDALKESAKASMKSNSSMVDMINTKARGNPVQLMKSIVTPVTSAEMDGSPYPYFIKNNLSEGLSPAEYWVSNIEARTATIEANMATAEPGDFGKQMFNALNSMVVTTKDCGTRNGVYLKVSDNNVLDRYLAKDYSGVGRRNQVVTMQIVQLAKKNKINELFVRSPMTCEARNGVCQLCYGLNVSGKLHNIGNNIGTIAAQSITEPMIQMSLSRKHGGVSLGINPEETGIKGVRKLLTRPKIFPSKAALSQVDGRVTEIRPASQGGYYIYVNGMEHYAPKENKVTVSVGQTVTKGDSLSSGLKDPREFTNLRGLGSGRNYLVDALYNAYNPKDAKGKRNGISLDKRHLEVLAKKDLNHVVIENNNDTFSKGDIVEYNKLKEYLTHSKKEVPINDSIGQFLGKEYLHYTVGTQITPHIANNLKNHGLQKIMITKRNVQFTPYVTNIRQIPLRKDNFVAQLSHQQLKDSLIKAPALRQEAEIKGYDPIPSFIQGVGFGEGIDGTY